MSVNIMPQNTKGKCDLKCAYSFTYPESTITAKNNGIVLNISYENRTAPPVNYNTAKYNVSKICLYSPSLHDFNGTSVDAELVVEHAPVLGGNNLYVCIPIVKSSETSTASSLITQIINSVSTNAPADGESTNLNISGFTLDSIVPKKPYFSYENTTQGLSGDYIVFGRIGAIPLSEETLTTLQSIIQPYPAVMTGGNLFFNLKGPNSNISNEGIYISCQPTGSSEETIDIVNTTSVASISMSSFTENPANLMFLKFIIYLVLILLLFVIIKVMVSYINPASSGSRILPTK